MVLPCPGSRACNAPNQNASEISVAINGHEMSFLRRICEIASLRFTVPSDCGSAGRTSRAVEAARLATGRTIGFVIFEIKTGSALHSTHARVSWGGALV